MRGQGITRRWCGLGLAWLVWALVACAPLAPAAPNAPSSSLHIDGADRSFETRASTVREALREVGVELGPLDRVEPPLWTPLQAGMAITVTRVWEEREERVITATAQLIRDEFLLPSEGRVLDAGSDGLEELTFRVSYDGPTPLQRELTAQRVVASPRPEVRLVGTKGTIAATEFGGVLAYIANGDAWVMRRSSADKRPLTREGNLDGRAFDLSPDGRLLLYTTAPTSTSDALNRLWVIETGVLNARPLDTGVEGALWAAWRPDGRAWACATARKTPGAPGWRADNNLLLVSWPGLVTTTLLPPTTQQIYSWWGEAWAWSPAGDRLAYAHADAVGVVALAAPARRPLYTFRPYHTHGDWVWLPTLAWRPDGGELGSLVHLGAEEEDAFALIGLDTTTGQARELAAAVGPWSGAAWSGAGLATGVRHADRDGEQYRLSILSLDPAAGPTPIEPADAATAPYVEPVWSPTERELILVREGDLWLFRLDQHTAQPLTASGLVSRPRWR